MKVLVVDDDSISRFLASKLLAKGGYDVLQASGAKEAIEYLEAAEPIGLVISDIIMPEMDGLELLAYIRNELGLTDLPVIMYTAKRDKATVIKTIKLRVKDYMPKPIRSGVLLSKVQEALKDEIPPLVDKDEMLNRLQIDEKIYNELLVSLIELTMARVEEMQEAVEQGDFERLIYLGDSSRSASISLGAKRLINASIKLVEAAQNQDKDKAEKAILAVKIEANILRDLPNLDILSDIF